MATLKDVAARAGVSIASVSTVINNTAAVSLRMRERVNSAVADLGYVPHALARNLKTGQANVIGLVLPDITNPHYSGLASSIEVACDEAGYSLMLCNSSDSAEKEIRHLRMMRAQQVRGIIFIAGGSDIPKIDALHCLLDWQAVLLDRDVPGLALDRVLLDNCAAGRLAMDHLLQHGHKQVGIVAGPPNLAVSQKRVAGCRAAMLERGMPLQDDWVVNGGFHPELAAGATRALIGRQPQLTAIVSCSNHTTIGVMTAFIALGLRCPANVSVVGIDDFNWAEGFVPRLTAVAQPIAAMGREAVRRLLTRQDAKTCPASVILPPRLILRASTRVLE